MSTSPPSQPPVNPAPAPQRDKFVAWIDVLDPDTDKQQGSLQRTKDLVSRLAGTSATVSLKSDTDLDSERKASAQKAIETRKSKMELMPSLKTDNTLQKLITDATHDVASLDLAVPDNNRQIWERIRELEVTVAARLHAIRPGTSTLLSDIVQLENSVEFKVADKLANGAFSPKLKGIKDEATGAMADVPVVKSSETLRLLRNDCTKISREFEKFDASSQKYQDQIKSMGRTIEDASNRVVQAGHLSAVAREQFQLLLAGAREALEEAGSLKPIAPQPPSGSTTTDQFAAAWVTAIQNHHTAVATQLALVQTLLDGALKFSDDYSQAGSAEEKRKLERLSSIRHQINASYDAAVAAGFAKDDALKQKHLGLTTSASDQELQAAETFARSLIEKLDQKEGEWREFKDRNQSTIRFGIQLLAETQASAAEELAGLDSRDATVKQRHAQVKSLLAEYDKAIAHARKREYQQAIDCFKAALGDSTQGLVKFRDTAQQAYQACQVSDSDLQIRQAAFHASLGELTDKSKIRFSDEAYEMMLGTGMTVDDDQEVTFSDQFRQMQDQLANGIAAWRGLREQGVDPFKAADRAFAGIPENFWPPEAVRAIAMFRLAEAEFAEERRAEELAESLRGGRVTRLAQQALDRVDAVLENKWVDKAGAIKGQATEKGGVAVSVGSGITSAIGNVKDQKVDELVQQFKDDNPHLSGPALTAALEKKESEFEQQAFAALNMSQDAFEKAEEAFKILGQIGTAISVVDGLYNMAKDGKDIVQAQIAIKQYDPETDSPVELKLRQFERMRAIWHLIDHLADTILSGLGFVPDGVPVVGDVASCLGDIKSLAIDAAQAAEYFKRLATVRDQKNQARFDPETMMELALANEAYKLGLLASQKTFDAAAQLVKFVGSLTKGVGELTSGGDFGATLITGFTINKVGMALEYGGKFFFYVKVKLDDRKAKKTLFAAKADPTNINAVEPVFERCTMYARFALAHGAIHGDRWARNYLLSRGVTDSDLDNPNTSTAILREYLNVTFQSKQFGDAEEDDDYGAGDRARREEAARMPDVDGWLAEPQYVGLWSPADLNLDSASFQANYREALKDRLKSNKRAVKAICDRFDHFNTERSKANPDASANPESAIVLFKKAYQEYDQALVSQASDLKQKKEVAKPRLETCVQAVSRFAAACDSLKSALVAFHPLTTSSTKQPVHEAMRVYLHELTEAVDREYEPVRSFRDSIPRWKLALDLELRPDDPTFIQKAQAKFNQDFEDQKEPLEEAVEVVEKEINARWDGLRLATRIGKANREALIKKAAQIIAPDDVSKAEAALDREISSQFDAVRNQITEAAKFAARKIVMDQKKAWAEAKGIKDDDARSKQMAKLKARRDQQIRNDAVDYWLDQAASQLREIFNLAVDAVAKQLNQAPHLKFDPDQVVDQAGTPVRFELTRTYWQACKHVLQGLNWKNSKSGIGEAMEDFDQAHQEWMLLKSDDLLQANWRSTHGKLVNRVHSLPSLTIDGVAVPGIDDLKKRFLAELKKKKDEFESDLSQEQDVQTDASGWVPTSSQLGNWPLTQDGWLLMHDLARKHGWEAHNSRKSIGRLFRKYEDAKQTFDTTPSEKNKATALKACEELIKRLEKWDPNTKAKRRKPDHEGIMAYRKTMIDRLKDIQTNQLS